MQIYNRKVKTEFLAAQKVSEYKVKAAITGGILTIIKICLGNSQQGEESYTDCEEEDTLSEESSDEGSPE